MGPHLRPGRRWPGLACRLQKTAHQGRLNFLHLFEGEPHSYLEPPDGVERRRSRRCTDRNPESEIPVVWCDFVFRICPGGFRICTVASYGFQFVVSRLWRLVRLVLPSSPAWPEHQHTYLARYARDSSTVGDLTGMRSVAGTPTYLPRQPRS